MTSLVHTCTENGISDGTDEMTVNDIKPPDSSTLLVALRNWTTMIKQKLIFVPE